MVEVVNEKENAVKAAGKSSDLWSDFHQLPFWYFNYNQQGSNRARLSSYVISHHQKNRNENASLKIIAVKNLRH